MDSDQIGMGELFAPNNMRAYAAELFGTMLFVLMGTGAVVAVVGSGVLGGDLQSGSALVVIAMAHGLGIATMVYATANYSGGDLNPAVTLAMIVTRNIKVAPGVAYMVAQLVGAVFATLLLYLALKNSVGNLSDFGAHGVNTEIVDGNGGALVIESVLTAALVSVIFAVAVSKRGFGVMAPLAIGLTVMLIHFVAVFMTGASVNPARTFGPALVSNAFDSFWVYLLGPAIGAVLAGLLYHHVFLPSEDDAPT